MGMKELIKRRVAKALTQRISHRRYLDPSVGLTSFFQRLKEEEINYVVLRWFENLPHLAPGEDIDILVSDEHVDQLTAYLSLVRKRNSIPLDIYSVSGLSGTDSNNMAYYPVSRAHSILDHAVWLNKLIRVPGPDEHFLSMCYHAIYHKGYKSGLPSRHPDISRKVIVPNDHNYLETIKQLYKKSTIEIIGIEFTLEGINDLMVDQKWSPSLDTLVKMSKKNIWIQDSLLPCSQSLPSHLSGLAVFLVREGGVNYLSFIEKLFFDEGFDIIIKGKIESQNKDKVANEIRGGNWGKGPWSVSGGLPVYYYLLNDAKPIVPTKSQISEHIGLDNARILYVKNKIRNMCNEGKSPDERSNIVHSSDSSAQAVEYIKIIDKNILSLVDQDLKRRFMEFTTPYPIIKDLSKHARRAKVELIDFNGRLAICKTFKKGRESYLKREVDAREIGRDLEEMSKILKIEENHIVIEYYDDIMSEVCQIKPLLHTHGFMPIWTIEKIKQIILYFRSRGYECVDFNPKNIVVDRDKGLKAIDFEFLQKGDRAEQTLYGNYAWYNAPSDFDGAWPKIKKNGNLYNRRWLHYTGLPRFFCLYDFPLPILYIVRSGAIVYFSCYNFGRRFILYSKKK